MAKRSYPSPKVRGSHQECQAEMAQERPRGATPCPRSGQVAKRSNPTFKVRRGGHEKITLIQGKEQQLRFAGAAMKGYPTSKRNPSKTVGVVRGHQRADTLKPNHRQVVNLITWTTTLSNSMKLSYACVGPPKTGGSWLRDLTECGPLEKGMANHFSILALRTP